MVPLKQLTGAEVGQPSQSYAFPLVLVVTCLAQQSLQVGRGDGSQRLSHRESRAHEHGLPQDPEHSLGVWSDYFPCCGSAVP